MYTYDGIGDWRDYDVKCPSWDRMLQRNVAIRLFVNARLRIPTHSLLLYYFLHLHNSSSLTAFAAEHTEKISGWKWTNQNFLVKFIRILILR